MDVLERIAQLSPAKLALLEQKLQKNRPSPAPRPAPAERQRHAPLSFAQERLWFLDQLEPDTGLYNLPAILPLRGPADPGQVEAAILRVVSRHGALRTRFVMQDERPWQVVGDDAREALDFSTIDLRGAGPASDGPQLARALNDHLWAPFDLSAGPLLRARLILRRGDENLLLVVMHHIISDGWSLNLFTRELRALYDAERSGRPANLPPPPQYVDHAIEQRRTLEGERLQSLLSYWRAQLDGAPSRIALPLDRPRPARQSFRGALHPFAVPRPALQKLGQLCREQGVVPFMVLLSAFKVLLFRYTDQPKIVVGTPIANRARSELESVIGFFTNTLVLCSSLSSGMTFRELVSQVKKTTLGAYEHQELPFEKLVSELQPERSLSHNPLFQVMFTFQNLPAERAAPRDEARPPQGPPEELGLDFRSSKFDLTLAMTETDGGISAVFEYATDLFEAATVERMAGHLVNVLQHVLEHPDEPIAGFDFLPAPERALVLDLWNDTRCDWPEVLPLHARFERQARRTPDAEAVAFQGASLTYRELDRRANRVARALRSGGVGRGAIVGICLPRSLEMLAGLYGILKAGAAYLPIEPDFPEERVAYMLADAKVGHVLTTSACLPALAPHPVKAVALDRLEPGQDGEDDAAVPVELGPDDLAYVLFTSGSTGQPKGVMISHAAIDNRLQWMQAEYGLQPHDRVMQKTPFTFDVSVWELFWPLAVGACLVVAEPERHKESVYLVDLIRKERITCLHFVPSMLQLFLHEDLAGCDSLTRIFCSGEALAVEHVRRLQALPGVQAHNLYGPTEAAVDVTYWDCARWRDQYLSVPIGRPIANTQIYILNDRLQPAPIGVPGELYIGGRNLALGYLNKPELTASRFIASPFAKEPDARLYRTGDLARFRDDGNIEYIGRLDSQVKLRGLRIELGEIETVLGRCPGVAEAAAVIHRFGAMDERLAAYVVPAPGAAFDASAARAFLGKKLPSYMVPATITVLPELPLTPNGKLDRKRLPQPAAAPRTVEPVASASDLERELLAIWRKVLKTEAVGAADDFFALGGHSLLVTQVINAINRQYHLEVPVRLLFENPTVKALARALSELEDQTWLDGSQAAAAMLTRSDLRLLQTLDQRSEQELDELLKRLIEEPAARRFDDARSLLAWARSYRTPHGGAAPAAAAEEVAPAAPGSPAPPDLNGRIFEGYARWSRERFLERGREMTPAELRDFCIQLMAMANLAAALGRS